MGLGEITRQASSFIQDKYKTAKCVINDVSQAELLAEEATNKEPCSPDARTMTRISEAAFEFDDYWRIVDVLHRRLHIVDFKEWRKSYKALVLLEFLLTHGPEDIGKEFHCDIDVIQELGTFEHVDERGIDWGSSMQKKSNRILKLLNDGQFFKEEREKALKVSSEIKGFGNSPLNSPSSSSRSSSSSSSPSSSSKAFRCSSAFGSSAWNINGQDNRVIEEQEEELQEHDISNKKFTNLHCIREEEMNLHGNVRPHQWNIAHPTHERGSLLDPSMNDNGNKQHVSQGKIGFRSLSEVGKVMRKKFDRQLSLGF